MINKAEVEELVLLTDEEPGYSRRKHGVGFSYYTPTNKLLRNAKERERLESLAVPPVWKNVWMSTTAMGYLQATGRDARKRKQYIYHDLWREYRNWKKFDRLKELGEGLPTLRAQLANDIQAKGWPKRKVIAIAIQLMDDAYLRVGNLQYALRNDTYGLTTLRRRHMVEEDGDLVLEFSAKSNKDRKVRITNKRLANLVRKCADQPGYELFRYKEDGMMKPIHSGDVNDYLRDVTGMDITAKTFRSWNGSELAISMWPLALTEIEEHPKRSLKRAIVKRVARRLANTVSVCESYYIHPHVLEHLLNHGDVQLDLRKFSAAQKKALTQAELKLLQVLSHVPDVPEVEPKPL